MLEKVKVALRITTDVYNTEIQDLIDACYADLQITDIFLSKLEDDGKSNPLIIRAVILYCKMYFGFVEDGEFIRLKRAYDEIKAQLSMNSEFTKWEIDGGDIPMDIDSALSLTSINPVQNKVITQAINDTKAEISADLARIDSDMAIINSDIVGINTSLDSVRQETTALNVGKQDKLTAGNRIQISENIISVSKAEEAQILGWTAITQGVYTELDLTELQNQYHRFTILLYVRKGEVRQATKFELTIEELLKILSKATTHPLYISRPIVNPNNENAIAFVRQAIQRPTQENEGIGIIRLKYEIFANGTQISNLDNIEFCLYAE